MLTRALNYLTDKSLIIFKKYKNSYALYEGSDFDIEDELAKALKEALKYPFQKLLRIFFQKKLLQEHYLQTGSLRWAEMALCTPDEVSDIIEGFKPKSSQFALFLIVSTEDTQVVSTLVDRFEQKEKPIIFGKNVLHSDMFEFFSEYYALQGNIPKFKYLLKIR